MTDWQRIKRWCGLTFLALLVIGLLGFATDWLIWRVHLAHGTGIGTVQVTRMVVAPLKGNREEYYADGTEDVSCSRSIFPQGGSQSCWWLSRHRIVFER